MADNGAQPAVDPTHGVTTEPEVEAETAPGTAVAANDADAGWVTARTHGTGYRTVVRSGEHVFVADEPSNVGGTDEGASPYDPHVLGRVIDGLRELA